MKHAELQEECVRPARLGRAGIAGRLHNVSYATFAIPACLHRLLPFFVAAACFGVPRPSLASIQEPVWGYLDNGMAYVLLESHAAPLIGSSVIVHSGSAREDMATSGASHFLEHLLFNGTTTRTQEQLYDEVDAIGGYNNATTRKTHVAYMMVTPAEKIRTGMEIQADMLFHSTIDPAKVEKERGIILAEMAKDQDSGTFEQERTLDLAVFGPAGPGLPTLGSVQSLKSISRATIFDFYKRLYTPQNMTLVVVGDFASGEMEGEIRQVFGAEPPGPTPPASSYPEPHWDPNPALIPTSGDALVLEGTWRAPNPTEPAFLATQCVNDLLTGDESAPLNKALRDRFGGQDPVRGRPPRLGARVRPSSATESRPTLPSIGASCTQGLPGIIHAVRVAPRPADVEAWKVSTRNAGVLPPGASPLLRDHGR